MREPNDEKAANRTLAAFYLFTVNYSLFTCYGITTSCFVAVA